MQPECQNVVATSCLLGLYSPASLISAFKLLKLGWDGALLSDMPPERGRIRLVYDPGAFRGGLTGAGLGILFVSCPGHQGPKDLSADMRQSI